MKEDEARRVAETILTEADIRNIHCESGVYSEDPWAKHYSFARRIIAAALVKMGEQAPVYQAQYIGNDWRDVDAQEFARLRGSPTIKSRALYAHPAPSQQEERKPLTDEQINIGRKKLLLGDASSPLFHAFNCGVRYAEAAHGIMEQK